MPSHFTLRMQFGPHQDSDEITEQLIQLVQEAPVDEIMFFYFGEEQNNGHESLERIQEWIGASRPYRQALKERGIAVSLHRPPPPGNAARPRSLAPASIWRAASRVRRWRPHPSCPAHAPMGMCGNWGLVNGPPQLPIPDY